MHLKVQRYVTTEVLLFCSLYYEPWSTWTYKLTMFPLGNLVETLMTFVLSNVLSFLNWSVVLIPENSELTENSDIVRK